MTCVAEAKRLAVAVLGLSCSARASSQRHGERASQLRPQRGLLSFEQIDGMQSHSEVDGGDASASLARGWKCKFFLDLIVLSSS